MARPINTNPTILKGKEAKKVLERIKNPNCSPEYQEKMESYVAYYKEIEKKSKSRK
jgi:hypothetical protein